MGEFVGGRIVPKHCGTWNKRSKYEMLSIVYQPETGDSYISRKSVLLQIRSYLFSVRFDCF